MIQIKDRLDYYTFVAAAAINQGDPIFQAPWFGVACNKAAIGDDVTIDIREGVEVDDTSTVAVAATLGAAIYWNPTTKAYAASSSTGFALVGYTTKIKDANNCFRYEKLRRTTVA